jgi:cytochrome b561
MQAAATYSVGARAFHWATVALLLAIIPIGLVMGALPRGTLQNVCFITHESLGLTVLGLTVLRFLWRLRHAPPPPSADLTPLEQRASRGVHALLYGLLLVMPATGYLFVTFSGIDVHYFGLMRVPALVEQDKPTGELFLAIHVSLQWAIYALAAMHIGAALHHHFRRRNDVLTRMLPSLRPLGQEGLAELRQAGSAARRRS